MRLLRSFVVAVLAGAMSAAVVIGAILAPGWLIALVLVALGVVVAGSRLLTRRPPAAESTVISTSPGVVRYTIDGVENPRPSGVDETDRPLPDSTAKRQIPYGLQVVNIVLGLAVGVAGVLVAALKT